MTNEDLTSAEGRGKAQALRDYLDSLIKHSLPAHAKLPTERSLAAKYGINRATVRNALNQLELEGAIYRKQGSGTYVAEPRITKSIELTSFSDDMAARGLTPGCKVLITEVQEASSSLAFKLSLSPGAPVIHLRRLRTADNQPMCIEDVWIPQTLTPDLLKQNLEGSLYELLESKYHLSLTVARQIIDVSTLSRRQSELLGTAPHSPTLRVTRIVKDSMDRHIEYAVSLYRGDRYNFDFTVQKARGSRF
ncbi:GntR family transcriptional regulator [Bifidobacterium asteroides]|uniref:GntR family transcriptional regulator n=1 Tax=Bifidobacterium asteroides TaxID=1684 RepID=A0ABS3IW01_9BIFI|nr:GntR family transcriptional regulator [Bifidobacterium asteroides]MCP8614738.1 GntR family transcriptional regulator [Bifidobacterium asteroides]